jgi:phosphatidylglycerol lysyltransferase
MARELRRADVVDGGATGARAQADDLRAAAPKGAGATVRARLGRYLVPVLIVVLFGAALALLHHELAEQGVTGLRSAIDAIPWQQLLLALALAALGYLVLTVYDVLAMIYIERRVPYRGIALASFVAYAFSNSISFGLIAAASIRYRLYAAFGLSAAEITEIVGFTNVTLVLGFATLIGLMLASGVLEAAAAGHFLSPWLEPLGFVLLALVGAYVLLGLIRRRPFEVRGWRIAIPSPLLALGQVIVGSLDLSFAASVLYVLLPSGSEVGVFAFLGIYLVASAAGIASHVPGGIGVFESIVVLLLTPEIAAPAVLGALLGYRLIYYVIPLCLGAGLLAAHEIWHGRKRLGRLAHGLGRLSSLAPQAFALVVFLSGVVLLVSGATPAIGDRLAILADLLPLPLIEASHFLGSLAGAALLLVARGLQRRLDAAWLLTLVLLAAGIAFCLLKGLDYEEAAVLALLFAALLPCRHLFYRRAALTSVSFTPAWLAALAVALLGAAWLGFFAYRHVDYAGELWWRFALDGDAPRFLRAGVGVAVLMVGLALARLLRPAPAELKPPLSEEMARAAAIAAAAPETSANLALLGDKTLLFSEAGDGFLMYGVSGRSWISMGDPVGSDAACRELAWLFRERADRNQAWTVFYEVGAGRLPLYLDLGLSPLKIGEEARVSLTGFSLAGHAQRELRQIHGRFEREGGSFEIVPATAVPALLPQLKAISDAWLGGKNVREKGFSLGWFEPAYLERFPVALVRRGNDILAFANLWQGGGRDELSIDLMRYLPDAPRGVMDYLLISSMLWGATEGYRWFNLGMAPLAGLEDRALAPAWARLSAFVFRHGEHFYNFQGLRQYKAKFEPVWAPRYLVSPGGLALPRILLDVATLIAGGLRGVISK